MTPREWQPISSAPKDGSRFLAWCRLTADEFDEDDCKMGSVTEHYAVVAYFVLGGFVEFPWRGSFPVNLEYLNWQPLPKGPVS